jgi:hypothetical protein
MNTPDVYAALRTPRRKYGPTLMVFAACGLAGWLGWCGVLVAQAARDAYAAKACANSGGTWNYGNCSVPTINIEIVPRGPVIEPEPGPTRQPAPWGGQMPGAL